MNRQRTGQVLMIGGGLVHLLPAAAVTSRARLEQLYGITVTDRDLELLLRHRALFFGLVGVGLLAGALLPRLRAAALVSALASLAGWIALASQNGSTNPDIVRVTRVDVALVIALATAAVLLRRDERAQARAVVMPLRYRS